jgi:hypothetical protein
MGVPHQGNSDINEIIDEIMAKRYPKKSSKPMKNRLRITGNIWADTILMLIMLSTAVVLVYGWWIDFPKGFPDKKQAIHSMWIFMPLTLVYFVVYVVIEGLIAVEETEVYDDKAEY